MDDSIFNREQMWVLATRDIDFSVWGNIAMYRLMERYGLPLADETENYYMFDFAPGISWLYLNKLPYELSFRLDFVNKDNEWETETEGPFACTLNESDPL